MLTATCMQPGKSTAAVMVAQGAFAQFSPAAAAAPIPPLATASAEAQAHWRRRPQNKSRAASPCLRQLACNWTRAQQSLWWFKGLLSAQFSPAAAAAPSPPLATASAVAQAHWHRRPQNKSSSSLVIGSCIGVPSGLDCARCLPRWPAITLRPATRQGRPPPAPSDGIGPTA